MAVPSDLLIGGNDDGLVAADKFNRGLQYIDAAGATTAGDAAAAEDARDQAVAAAGQAQKIVLTESTGLPNLRPSLLLDFVNSDGLDPRVIATRASSRTYWDRFGVLREAPPNVWPQEFDPATGEGRGRSVWAAATNLARWSQDWSKVVSGVAAYQGVNPAPGDAEAFSESASSIERFIDRQFASVAGESYAFSFLCDGPPGGREISYRVVTGFADAYVRLRADGTHQANSSTIQNAKVLRLPGDKFFVSFTSVATESSSAARVRIQPRLAGGGAIYDGDPSMAYRVQWVQAERGSVPTPRIPTEGSTVTRATDVVRVPLPSGLMSRVTLVIDYIEPAQQNSVTLLQIDSGGDADRFNFRRSAAGELVVACSKSNQSLAHVFLTPQAPAFGQVSRAAICMDGSRIHASINGALPISSTQSAQLSVLAEHLRIGSAAAGGEQPGAQIMRVSVYEHRAVTNAQLQALSAL